MSAICTAMGEATRNIGGAADSSMRRRAFDAGQSESLPIFEAVRAGVEATRVGLAAGAQLILPASAASVVLAIPLDGEARVDIAGARVVLNGRKAVLSTQDATLRTDWPAGGIALLVRFRRSAIQAEASAAFGEARRLVRGAFVLEVDRSPYVALLASSDIIHAGEACERTVAALATQHGVDQVFPGSRSISLARRRLDADPTRAWDLEDLARGAGVTPITLQRGFRECLGTTVAGYAQAIRLQQARACLSSGRDSRSVAAIAHAMGFATSASFVRAYQRLFGETPTQTRSNAVLFSERCRYER